MPSTMAWRAGRLGWTLDDAGRAAGSETAPPRRAADLDRRHGTASLERVGKLYDGWFPNAPDTGRYREQWQEIQAIAREAGRDPAKLTGAVYLTVTLDDDVPRADARLNQFLETYYGQPAAAMRQRQACYAGRREGVAAWVRGFVDAGASHLVLRFAGDHDNHLDALAGLRAALR